MRFWKNLKKSNIVKILCVLAVIVAVTSISLSAAIGLKQTEPEDTIKKVTASIPVEAVSPSEDAVEESAEAEVLVYQKKDDNMENSDQAEDEDPTEDGQDEKDDPEETEEEQKDEDKKTDDQNNQNDQPTDDANQNTDSSGDKPGDATNPNQDGNGDGGNQGNDNTHPTEGPTDDTKYSLITDLSNQVITYDQLTNDKLEFQAYLVNAKPDMSIKVKVKNTKTSGNGTYLTADGKKYSTTLARSETNVFTIYVKENSKTVDSYTYHVLYTSKRADENHPSVGEHPPTIATNLDGFSGEMTNRNFTFTVKARTYENKVIPESNVEVKFDGKAVKNPTGNSTLEYQLYMPTPDVGDYEDHTVTVRAWDNQENSKFKKYTFRFRFVDSGDVIGKAYVVLDATTVGLGIVEEAYEYEIKQGEPASYAVMAMLEANGYSVTHGGSLDNGFYLKRISRGGFMSGASVPEKLWKKIQDDDITLTGQRHGDSLGEFDFTQGAGWMYSVDGHTYAGKSLSNYFLSDGDTLYLRFTLAYGKDIGGYSASSGNHGKLSTYCGKWLNGSYTDEHKWEEKVTKEATCTEKGEKAKTCKVCGDKQDAVQIDALGHNFKETKRVDATTEKDGYVEYTCKRCGTTKRDTIPKKEGKKEETTEPEESKKEEDSGNEDGGDDGGNDGA